MPLTRKVEITPYVLTRETVNLSAESVIPMPNDRRKEPSRSVQIQGGERAPSSEPILMTPVHTPITRGRSSQRTVALILVSAGVAAVVTGLVFGLEARSAAENDSKAPVFDADKDNTGHRYQTLQYIGYGAGAALLIGGAATLLIASPRRVNGEEHHIAVAGIPGRGAMAQLRWQF
jgi:hypothetical protein